MLRVAIDFHSVFIPMEINGYERLLGYQHSSKIFFFVHQKTETHTGLKGWVNDDRISIFVQFI